MRRFLLTFASLIFLATPFTALASTQIIMGGNGLGNTANTYPLEGQNNGNSNDGSFMDAMPVAGTFSNLYLYMPLPPGGSGTETFTLLTNDVGTSITCTISSASNTCTDLIHTEHVSAGDHMHASLTKGGTGVSKDANWSLTFTPDNSNDTVFLGAGANNGAAGTLFNVFLSRFNSSTESRTSILIPEAGTLDSLYDSSPSFTSGSYQFAIWLNAASTSPLLSCTAGTPSFNGCSDTTHSVSVATGDLISFRQVAFSPGQANKGGFGVRFVPSTAGHFDLTMNTSGGNADVAGATRYLGVNGVMSGVSAEASTTAQAGGAYTISSIVINRSSAPGSAKNATYTLRVNGADSSLSCTLTGTGSGTGITNKTCSGSVSVNPTDLIDTSVTLTSGGTASLAKIGYVASPIGVATVPHTFLSNTLATTWTVPNDWTNTDTIECIGAGGNGSSAISLGGTPGAGGGGGSYALQTNQVLTPGSTVTIQVAANSTQDTFIKDNSGNDIIRCGPGQDASLNTPGSGGSSTGGSVNYVGGNGGTATNNTGRHGGGGGGGAGGPAGAGQTGGAGGTSISSGGGGGGGANSGGNATAGASAGGSANGGAGGLGVSGTGGGGNGGTSGVDAGSGVNGGGGGGGAGAVTGSHVAGASGGSDYSYSSFTYGPSGGGGGGGGTTTTGGAGGAGGAYGGGGGGGGADGGGNGAGGAGGQGLIIITYNRIPKAKVQIFGGSVRIMGGSVRIK